MKFVRSSVAYLCARIKEASTWTAIGVGVTGAAALAPPWSYVFIAVAVIGALAPTTKKECGHDG